MFSLLLILQKKQTSKGAGGLKLVRLHGDITFLTLIFPVFRTSQTEASQWPQIARNVYHC